MFLRLVIGIIQQGFIALDSYPCMFYLSFVVFIFSRFTLMRLCIFSSRIAMLYGYLWDTAPVYL